jgi:hypothetical protein
MEQPRHDRRWIALVTLALACAGSGSKTMRPDPGNGGEAGEEGGNEGGTGGSKPVERPDAARRTPDSATSVEPDAAPMVSSDGGTTTNPPDAAIVTPPAAGVCAKRFGSGAISEWVHYDAQGKLVYKALNAQGDRIMDFSHAGYRGGGVALPTVPTAVTIGPSGGDDSAAIQAAIDMVSRMPLVAGVRGAVLLKPGMYKTATTLDIAASGVVLRGSGAGDGGTIIDLTDTSHLFLKIHGAGGRTTSGPKVTITDDHVPAGATSFTVSDGSAFKVGDAVVVGRPVTAAWIKLLGMDQLVRNGAQQTWLGTGFVHTWERKITAIAGGKVTIDVPLSDSFDGPYVKPPGGSMQKYSFDGRLSQVGVEDFKIVAPKRTAAQANDPSAHGGSQFAEVTGTTDSWMRRLAGHNTVEGIHIESGSSRITVEDTVITHDPTDYFTASAPFDYNINAAQVLIQRSASKGGNKIMMMTTHYGMGPNVLLNFDGDGPNSHIQPHMHWATGLLIDNAVANSPGTGTNAGIAFMNRGTGGSGHGWAVGWGVAWNCTAPGILMQQPGGSMNWAIGCKGAPSAATAAPGVPGTIIPNGIFESTNAPVAPNSLYLAQLCERLGPEALTAIGYP